MRKTRPRPPSAHRRFLGRRALEPHAPELTADPIQVRAVPVDVTAARTPSESRLRHQHEGGNLGGDGCGIDVDRQGIAAHAAAEKTTERVDRERAEDLPELVMDEIALDEEMRGRIGILDDPPVAGEQRASAPPGLVDQPAAREVRAVEDVAPDEAKPACEAAEHLV